MAFHITSHMSILLPKQVSIAKNTETEGNVLYRGRFYRLQLSLFMRGGLEPVPMKCLPKLQIAAILASSDTSLLGAALDGLSTGAGRGLTHKGNSFESKS